MIHKDSDRLKSLLEAFKSAEETVKTVVLNTKAKTVEEYKLKVEKKLDRVNVGLVKQSMSWANSDMPKAYKDGKDSVDSSRTSRAKIDNTDVENAYILLAQNIQHATDIEKENIRLAIERAEKENKYGATVAKVKTIIEEELSKGNPSMTVEYSNGVKMPLSAHAEMLARTSRIISANTGSIDRCTELGIDLVRCTTVPGCCPYCKKFEGKVFSISGKDSRFLALYGSGAPFEKGYNIMHPNCRHEFIPFIEQMESPEKLKEIIKDSNDIKEYSKDDKLFDLYKRGQAQRRQLVKESRLFHKIKDELGDDSPYSNISSFRRAYRSSEKSKLKYARTHYYNRDKAQFERWKETISDELPETLDEFQKIKYTKYEKYAELKNFREYKKDNSSASLSDFCCACELKKAELRGIPQVPIQKIDISGYNFNEDHVNKERGHNVNRRNAEEYLETALFCMTQWNGRRKIFYSLQGATCIDLKEQKIITAYSASQYDEQVKKAIEVYYKWKK